MKKSWFIGGLAAGLMAAGLMAADARGQLARFPDEARQALRDTVAQAQAALAESGIPKDVPLSLLPIRGDTSDRYVEGQLKNALTGAGLRYVEGRGDPFWDELLAQIEWIHGKDDILDAATLTKFGRLQNAKLLAYAFIREASVLGPRVFVEIELHVSEIETARHLWGATFSRRLYVPGQREGLVSLDKSIREALETAIAAKAGALEESEKLRDVRTILAVPLAADMDGYIAGMVKAMFNRSPIRLRDTDVPTLAQARIALRDGGLDGVLHGAVRDLYREVINKSLTGTTYNVRAEVQLEIQAVDGDVLWADQIVANAQEFVPVVETLKEEAKRTLVETIRARPILLLWGALGIVAIFLFVVFLRATRRVR